MASQAVACFCNSWENIGKIWLHKHLKFLQPETLSFLSFNSVVVSLCKTISNIWRKRVKDDGYAIKYSLCTLSVYLLIFSICAIYCTLSSKQNAECRPSVNTIAGDIKLSPATVRIAIKDLKKSGLIETKQRYHEQVGKGSLLYKLKHWNMCCSL